MPRGGRRPGAGRKKGSSPSAFDKENARTLLRNAVVARMPELIDAQIANACGLKYMVVRDKTTGKFERVTETQVQLILEGKDDDRHVLEVWEKDPSVQAFTDLMNRTIDKPAEQIQADLSHSGELTIIVKGME